MYIRYKVGLFLRSYSIEKQSQQLDSQKINKVHHLVKKAVFYGPDSTTHIEIF